MFWTVTQALMSGLWTTFEIFILTLIFALPLGLIFAFGLLSRFKPVKAVMNVFVWVIRGTRLCFSLSLYSTDRACGFIRLYGVVMRPDVSQRRL